jgi:small subunit ribosomal protein S4
MVAGQRNVEGFEGDIVARYVGPSCRLCRREGTKLYLKAERCFTDKCAVDRRKTAPGQHGARKTKLSEYGLQLREKQKLRRVYGVLERQFERLFSVAASTKGKTGDQLVIGLETRLDGVVLKLGLAGSRNAARQLVRHGHVMLNGGKCNIPSAVLKAGDKVELRDSARSIPHVLSALDSAKREGHGAPAWLKWDSPSWTGTVLARPSREDINIPVREQLVVELYSK